MNLHTCPHCGENLLKHRITPDEVTDLILEIVSEATDVSITRMKKPVRSYNIVFARHIAIRMLYEFTKNTMKSIGKIFNRDHTTVIHSMQRLRDLCDTEPDTRDFVEQIRNTIRLRKEQVFAAA